MVRRLCIMLLTASVLVIAGCGGRQQLPIPLPVAYPRPILPDTAMTLCPDAPLRFLVNADAAVSAPKYGWLDIAYPTLGATVHVTFTPTDPDRIDAVKDNRMERLMLNAGDRPTDFAESVNPAGFSVLLAESEGSLTPLQFLATDDSLWVMSGAVYFADPAAAASPDSIRPMVRAIRDDLVRALNGIDFQ